MVRQTCCNLKGANRWCSWVWVTPRNSPAAPRGAWPPLCICFDMIWLYYIYLYMILILVSWFIMILVSWFTCNSCIYIYIDNYTCWILFVYYTVLYTVQILSIIIVGDTFFGFKPVCRCPNLWCNRLQRKFLGQPRLLASQIFPSSSNLQADSKPFTTCWLWVSEVDSHEWALLGDQGERMWGRFQVTFRV